MGVFRAGFSGFSSSETVGFWLLIDEHLVCSLNTQTLSPL